MKPATRSAGTRNAPCGQWVRFNESWNDRLHRAAKSQQKTIQAFLFDAASAAIEKDEESRARQKEQRNERERESTPERLGFGIRGALKDQIANRGRRRTPEEETPPQQAQVVINTTARESPDINLGQLAKHVANGGPQWQRDERLREALKAIEISTADVEERHRLNKALHERIAKATGEPIDQFERVRKGLRGLFER